MNFLVVEGVDGSGKSTQIDRIRKHFETQKISYKYLHFPRTDTGIYGDLIARFLRGDMGNLTDVDPYLVALMYAGDRMDASIQIKSWLDQGYFVLLDRYVYSNIAFQCAKLADKISQHTLKDWIISLEYGYNKIPKPDLNILLNVPFSFTKHNLTQTRTGSERDYLQGMRDIHEEDLIFQQRVREMYLWQAGLFDDLKIIDCADDKDRMRSPDAVFDEIMKYITLNKK